MATITIPKKLAQEGDLVVVPRKRYERLLHIAKQSVELDHNLEEALREVKAGKMTGPFSSVRELKTSLGK
ncbi:MAG: hypothetical protein Q7S28_00210 [bacterium]|nr:hypothetical protein [bacterium]